MIGAFGVNIRICRGPIVRQQAASRPAKAPAFPRKRATQLRQV
jgi:hypothetical protein